MAKPSYSKPKKLTLASDQLKQDEMKKSYEVAFSVSPLLGDFRLVEKDTSSYLSRLNKVQQERLGHQLDDIHRQEERTLRDAHLQMCDVAKDRLELRRDIALSMQRRVNKQGKLLPMTLHTKSAAPRESALVQRKHGATSKSCDVHRQGTRRTSISDINGIVADGKGVRPSVNIPHVPKSKPLTDRKINEEGIDTETALKDPPVDDEDGNICEGESKDDVAATQDKQRGVFMDYKRKEELSRLKRNTVKTQRKWDSGTEHSKSLDRRGMPLIPTSSFSSRKTETKTSESVFDRLSKSSKINSMTSEDFFRSVKTQASRRPPGRGRHALTPPELSDSNGNMLVVGSNRTQRPRSLSPRPRYKLKDMDKSI